MSSVSPRVLGFKHIPPCMAFNFLIMKNFKLIKIWNSLISILLWPLQEAIMHVLPIQVKHSYIKIKINESFKKGRWEKWLMQKALCKVIIHNTIYINLENII